MELAKDKLYTYDEYATWDDDIRRELIDGIIYAMSAPSIKHQRIVSNLNASFFQYLKDKPCNVFPAPFDVRLNADDKNDTVVQPDLVVICDKSKLDDKKTCKGAPDLVIEITSFSTAKHS